MASQFSKKPITTFFLFALGITWVCWITALVFLVSKSYPVPSIMTLADRIQNGYQSTEHLILSLLFDLGTWGPMIAGITVAGIYYGKDRMKGIFKSMLKVKVHWNWYLIILAIPLAQSTISVISGLASGNQVDQLFDVGLPWYGVLWMFFGTFFTSGLEEPGWRGFATPELQKGKNAEDTGYIIGAIWGVWHLPFLFYLYYYEMNMEWFLIVLTMVGYVALVVPMGIINVWIYNNTKSVFLLILSHTLNNFLPIIIVGTMADSFSGIITAVLTWIFAGWVTKKYGKETLMKK